MKPLVILGEAWGASEARIKSSFVGSGGLELIRMLNEADIINLTHSDRDYIHRYFKSSNPEHIKAVWNMHPEIYLTDVFKLRAPRGDLAYLCGPKSEGIPGYKALVKSKYVNKKYESELERLSEELLEVDPNLIVCCGNTALWAMTGATGITKLRGTTLLSTECVAGFKILPIYNPSSIMRQWENRPTVVADLMKAKREKDYAEIRRPKREIWIEPTIADIRQFVAQYVESCNILSVDIETSGTRITCIGFSPSADLAIVIPFDDERAATGNYWSTDKDELECWDIIRTVLENKKIKKLFQNGLYDIAFLLRSYGIRTFGASEDTMLLQHALHPESLKGLGYLGSVYTDEGSWKHMRKKHETIKRDS